MHAHLATSTAPSKMNAIPGGTFLMGSDAYYPEEGPVHLETVDPFFIDRYAVTNDEFRRFVEETGYVTVAERPLDPLMYPGAPAEMLVPGGLVFFKTRRRVDLRDWTQWWEYVPGASWEHPRGPETSLAGLEGHPVVQIAFEDAETYAAWAGKALPTEAEWEFAARGGVPGATFAWGDDHAPHGEVMANTWRGEFPWQNFKANGYEGTSPVGAFPANGFGLHDMAGNVWEWTGDWFRASHDGANGKPCCAQTSRRGGVLEESFDPLQPEIHIGRKVIKGGSHLCAPNYCFRCRPAARSPQMIDSSAWHLGFRCIVRS